MARAAMGSNGSVVRTNPGTLRIATQATTPLQRIRIHPSYSKPISMIVTCLKAEELLFLARTTKHFRRVLMKRSSACIWRRALEDLEGLPPCPPTMTEPQYIALIFTEDCSSCGGRDMFGFFAPKLEADLLVRLCKECLEDKVVARNEIAPEIRDFVALKERGLLSDVEAVSRQLADLKATPGGRARLPAWKQDKLKQLADRRKRGGRIMQFLQRKAGEDKRAMKLYQQAEITRRLMVQGWSTEHMVIPKGSTADAQWTMYTHVWTTPCLELNRILMDNARERRQEPRWVRLEALWDTVKADLVRPAGTESTPRSLATAVSEALHIKPIPEFSDALEWPVIKELLNTDRPLSEMQARFVQKRPAIDREVTAWCMPYTPASRTIAKHRSNDPLQNLPLEMEFLLRADTIFAPYEADSQDCPSLHFCGYETYMRDLRRWIGYKSDEHWRLVNDSRFMMHSTGPTIARALLGALGRPLHTTILELEALGQRWVLLDQILP
ncbi:hypothetical protein BDV93DRAFT_509159 [Ceratobasidium sp. AG-I]|nr:hypothetical protein BDV93DRAFT_509159 [Ceratobasidium sp. AG-I]